MRCPKCDTTNSDFAQVCLNCGHSFVQAATYEDFVPDYPVAPPPPPAPGQYPPQQAPPPGYIYPGQASARFKRVLKPVVLIIIGLVLICICLGTPWYSVKATNGEEVRQDWTLTKLKVYFGDNSDSAKYTDDTFKDSKVVPVYTATMIITILALIMTILFLVFTIVAAVVKPKLMKINMVFGLLAFILILIAPIYMMIGIPAAETAEWEEYKDEVGEDLAGDKPKQAESFFGTESGEGYESSWGGSTAWFLAIIAFVFLLISFLMVRKAKSTIEADAQLAAPPPGYAPPPAPAYPPAPAQPQAPAYPPAPAPAPAPAPTPPPYGAPPQQVQQPPAAPQQYQQPPTAPPPQQAQQPPAAPPPGQPPRGPAPAPAPAQQPGAYPPQQQRPPQR